MKQLQLIILLTITMLLVACGGSESQSDKIDAKLLREKMFAAESELRSMDGGDSDQAPTLLDVTISESGDLEFPYSIVVTMTSNERQTLPQLADQAKYTYKIDSEYNFKKDQNGEPVLLIQGGYPKTDNVLLMAGRAVEEAQAYTIVSVGLTQAKKGN